MNSNGRDNFLTFRWFVRHEPRRRGMILYL